MGVWWWWENTGFSCLMQDVICAVWSFRPLISRFFFLKIRRTVYNAGEYLLVQCLHRWKHQVLYFSRDCWQCRGILVRPAIDIVRQSFTLWGIVIQFMGSGLTCCMLTVGKLFFFLAADIEDWLQMNFKANLGTVDHTSWPIIFGACMWMIWKWPNEFVFNNAESKEGNQLWSIVVPLLFKRLGWLSCTARNTGRRRVDINDGLFWRQAGARWTRMEPFPVLEVGLRQEVLEKLFRDSWLGEFMHN